MLDFIRPLLHVYAPSTAIYAIIIATVIVHDSSRIAATVVVVVDAPTAMMLDIQGVGTEWLTVVSINVKEQARHLVRNIHVATVG